VTCHLADNFHLKPVGGKAPIAPFLWKLCIADEAQDIAEYAVMLAVIFVLFGRNDTAMPAPWIVRIEDGNLFDRERKTGPDLPLWDDCVRACQDVVQLLTPPS
jgi:hypothetical protein